MLNHNQLQQILPHVYPMLLIDRVIDIKKDKSLIAIKNITANEWPFVGYGQKCETFPETLLIEAAAQAALVLYHVSRVKEGERPRYVIGKVKAEFMGHATAGDVLNLEVCGTKLLDNMGCADVNVDVDAKQIAAMQMFFSVQR
ncbi:MAG: 3-hydroxyacyl-[acyl-carrier-protein] dehydratase FabZ [Candidatus Omnitrophica bacterium]|nr:3-hydroxyacyl-[acyl-carrier-protein] dehydratase FabZ [Candidatus Omnitrophota bacterium]